MMLVSHQYRARFDAGIKSDLRCRASLAASNGSTIAKLYVCLTSRYRDLFGTALAPLLYECFAYTHLASDSRPLNEQLLEASLMAAVPDYVCKDTTK